MLIEFCEAKTAIFFRASREFLFSKNGQIAQILCKLMGFLTNQSPKKWGESLYKGLLASLD